MVDLERAMAEFANAGFRVTHETDKVIEVKSGGGRTLYVNKKASSLHVVIEEGLSDQIQQIFGNRLGDLKTYFNSNMREFPQRQNRGRRPERYGISLRPDNSATLSEFLRWFSENQREG
jgi:hypothetical protein